jgi:hypothetical protein
VFLRPYETLFGRLLHQKYFDGASRADIMWNEQMLMTVSQIRTQEMRKIGGFANLRVN